MCRREMNKLREIVFMLYRRIYFLQTAGMTNSTRVNSQVPRQRHPCRDAIEMFIILIWYTSSTLARSK